MNVFSLDLHNKNVLYVLGFLWADGWLCYNTIGIDLKSSDFDNVYQNFIKIGEWNFKHRKRFSNQTKKFYNSSTIKSINKERNKILESFDFKQKSIMAPSKLLNEIPDELKNHFFRGYIDGDGSFSIYRKGKDVKFNITSTINQDWIFITDLFQKIEISSYKIYEYNRKSGKSSSVIVSNKWDILKIGEYIYENSNDLRLERKYNKFIDIKNSDIKKGYPKWTKEEIDFLINNYSNGVEYCSSNLNRSHKSIYKKIHQIKMSNPYKKWTEDEICFLNENYKNMSLDEIGKKLNRCISSIINKINKLKKLSK